MFLILILRCLLAAASMVAVTALASAPVGWHGLQWFGLVGLLVALEGTGKRAAVLVGLAAGLGANVSLFTWLVPATATYGKIPEGFAWAAFAVLVAFLSLQHAVVALIDAQVRARDPAARWWMLLAAWITLEWLWPRLFPWHLGTAQVQNRYVVQLAAEGGPLLISTVLVAVNLALFELARWAVGRGPKPGGSIAAVVVSAVLVAVVAPRARPESPSNGAVVGWVQPGVVMTPANDVTEMQVWKALLAGVRSAGRGDGDQQVGLVVLPEGVFPWMFAEPQPPAPGAAPALIKRLEREVRLERRQLRKLAEAAGCPILIGATTHKIRAGATDWEVLERRNTLVLVTPGGGVTARYDKRQLLPLAESLPLESTFPILREWMPFAGRMVPGEGPRRVEINDVRIGPLICFEGVWSREVRALLDEGPVDLLVNATNDTWFPGQGPHLHDMIVRMRAVEARRPILRITTDGVSSLTSPWGESVVLGSRRATTKGVIALRLGRTERTRYMQTGDAPWGGAALLLLLGYAWRRRRR